MDYNGKDDEMVDKPVDESIDNITGRLTPTKKYGDHSLDGWELPKKKPECPIHVKEGKKGIWKRIREYIIPVLIFAGMTTLGGYHLFNRTEPASAYVPKKQEPICYEIPNSLAMEQINYITEALEAQRAQLESLGMFNMPLVLGGNQKLDPTNDAYEIPLEEEILKNIEIVYKGNTNTVILPKQYEEFFQKSNEFRSLLEKILSEHKNPHEREYPIIDEKF